MPDITLRFHRDMLVLSASLDAVLERQGFDMKSDREYANLVEPEAVQDALRLNQIAGAQCLVTDTAGMTPARLMRQGLEERGGEVAKASLATVNRLKPQHSLFEVGPCELPLDPSSKSSLNEHRDQYARAARFVEGGQFDAFFLNGFTDATDLKCALMGVRQVSGSPVFASVIVDEDGKVGSSSTFEEALDVMIEFEASVIGFETALATESAELLVQQACRAAQLPVLAQIKVGEHNPKQGKATPSNPYYCPDVVVETATKLRACGAQFLRATGQATPAYTGALAASTAGFDVHRLGIAE